MNNSSNPLFDILMRVWSMLDKLILFLTINVDELDKLEKRVAKIEKDRRK